MRESTFRAKMRDFHPLKPFIYDLQDRGAAEGARVRGLLHLTAPYSAGENIVRSQDLELCE